VITERVCCHATEPQSVYRRPQPPDPTARVLGIRCCCTRAPGHAGAPAGLRAARSRRRRCCAALPQRFAAGRRARCAPRQRARPLMQRPRIPPRSRAMAVARPWDPLPTSPRPSLRAACPWAAKRVRPVSGGRGRRKPGPRSCRGPKAQRRAPSPLRRPRPTRTPLWTAMPRLRPRRPRSLAARGKHASCLLPPAPAPPRVYRHPGGQDPAPQARGPVGLAPPAPVPAAAPPKAAGLRAPFLRPRRPHACQQLAGAEARRLKLLARPLPPLPGTRRL
jgi:hypothetical protein